MQYLGCIYTKKNYLWPLFLFAKSGNHNTRSIASPETVFIFQLVVPRLCWKFRPKPVWGTGPRLQVKISQERLLFSSRAIHCYLSYWDFLRFRPFTVLLCLTPNFVSYPFMEVQYPASGNKLPTPKMCRGSGPVLVTLSVSLILTPGYTPFYFLTLPVPFKEFWFYYT